MVKLFGSEFDNFELIQLLLIAFLAMAGVWVGIEFIKSMALVIVLAVGAYIFYRFFGKGKKSLWEKMF